MAALFSASLLAHYPTTAAAQAAACAGNTAAGPNGWRCTDQRTVQITSLAAVITDTSQIVNGIVTVKLTAPSGITGDLTLYLMAADQYYTQTFSALSPGSHTLKFSLPTIPPDTYISANGDWNTSLQSAAVPSKSFAQDWVFLGLIRFSQYNTPNESGCSPPTMEMYVFHRSTCSYDTDSFRTQFVNQTFWDGTGASEKWGFVKPLGTTNARTLCGAKTLPPSANSLNTLVDVDNNQGACLTDLSANHSMATFPNPKNVPSAQLQCSYHNSLTLDNPTNLPVASRYAADLCPWCYKDFRGTRGHIDSYTDADFCDPHDPRNIDFGNFYTSTK